MSEQKHGPWGLIISLVHVSIFNLSEQKHGPNNVQASQASKRAQINDTEQNSAHIH
jgi:hypothetical protein